MTDWNYKCSELTGGHWNNSAYGPTHRDPVEWKNAGDTNRHRERRASAVAGTLLWTWASHRALRSISLANRELKGSSAGVIRGAEVPYPILIIRDIKNGVSRAGRTYGALEPREGTPLRLKIYSISKYI